MFEDRLEVTNIQGLKLNIIPEDFNIKRYNFENDILKKKFDGIRDLLSIIYISDISIIDTDLCICKINGYKSSEFTISYDYLYTVNRNDYLYEIYKWIYYDGNLIDKSTIARNIVSLHCRYKNILKIGSENLNSIKENYTYYLKTNTDEFLEEKKNIQLQIIEEGKTLSEALFELFRNMIRNLLAYLTFFATLILTNIFGEGTFEDIFTFESVQIFAFIILGSFVFLILSKMEANIKKKKVDYYLEDLKSGYGMMLGEKNVEKIIESVNSHKKTKDAFDKNKNRILFLWGIFNVVLFIILDWISKDIKIFGFIDYF